MTTTSSHNTRVHTGRNLEPAWQQLLDALARHGMLGCVAAAGALLDTGNPATAGSPGTAAITDIGPALGSRR